MRICFKRCLLMKCWQVWWGLWALLQYGKWWKTRGEWIGKKLTREWVESVHEAILSFCFPTSELCRAPSPGEQIAFSKLPWGGKAYSASLCLALYLLLLQSILFFLLWYPSDTFFLLRIGIFSLVSGCCCHGHKPFPFRDVGAVI